MSLPEVRHTYTEDVKAESLSNRFADHLIWKTVKPHMASDLEVSLFFILRDLELENELLEQMHFISFNIHRDGKNA